MISEQKYIFYLEPSANSELSEWLQHGRSLVLSSVGSDPSYLYHPHVSLTSFFKCASVDKAVAVSVLARELLRGSVYIDSEKLLTITETGSVILPITSNSLAQAVEQLAKCHVGVDIKPKQGDHFHISLGKQRAEEDIKIIIDSYGPPPQFSEWDIVMYRQEFASGDFEMSGPHIFKEIYRQRLLPPKIPLFQMEKPLSTVGSTLSASPCAKRGEDDPNNILL